ncbi:MAG: rRNA maturation RNase YbeY [Anaeromyxobacteraceae bacterium]
MTVRARSEHRRGAAALRRLRTRAEAYLDALGRGEAELSVLLVTDRRIRTLNREWRGKDQATDVLSFPQSEPPGHGPLLGDVVISLDTAARRADEDGRPVGVELDRYLAHGLLHLLGFDHERAGDAKVMAEHEERLVRVEGLVGAALNEAARKPERSKSTPQGDGTDGWTRTRTSTSTRSRSGSTARGSRARSSRTRSAR